MLCRATHDIYPAGTVTIHLSLILHKNEGNTNFVEFRTLFLVFLMNVLSFINFPTWKQCGILGFVDLADVEL